MNRNLKALISGMSLEEKAGLCSGLDFWHTKPIAHLGIPSVMMSDGPHGLRKQNGSGDHLGIGASIEAVCFPAACATAASFDTELMRELGKTLGNVCQAENVGVLLGPAVNQSAVRAEFRIYFRRPLPHRQDGRSVHSRRAKSGRGHEHQALCGQESRVLPHELFIGA